MRSTRKPSTYFSLKNTLNTALALMPAFLLALPISAFAFTFTVNDPNDVVDNNIGDGICATAGNVCTLRAAIQEANGWPGADSIILPDPNSLSPSDTRYLLNLTGSGESGGDLDITESVTVKGAGALVTIIDGNANDRIFNIPQASTSVTISDVTIQNGITSTPGGGISNSGDLTLRDSIVQNNLTTDSTSGGGGIYNQNLLTLDNVLIDNNNSQPANGGGISTNTPSSVTTINNSTFSNNSSVQSGGGIAVNAGTVTITDTTISANTSSQSGGGIHNAGALTIKRSTLNNNQAYNGAGISNFGGPNATLSIENSTISGNFSPLLFTSHEFSTSGKGGGLFLSSPTTLKNVTITNNRANGTVDTTVNPPIVIPASSGGGIYLQPGANLTLSNTIIANNSSGHPTDPDNPLVTPNNCQIQIPATVTSTGDNLADDATCNLAGGEITAQGTLGLNVLLDNNGGQTQTHALAAGSAVNAGQCDVNINTDQRGVARPGVNCDIGAYEFTSIEDNWSDLDVSITDIADPVQVNSTTSYRVSVKNLGPKDNISTTININDILNTLPTGLTYNTSSGDGTFSGGVWTLNTLNKGAEKVLNITADTGASPDTLTSTPILASADQNTANDSDSETTTLTTTTDLSVAFTSPLGGVVADQAFDYQFKVSNNGPANANNVVFTSQLPTSVASNSTPTASSGSCSLSASILSCNLGTISPGASNAVTVTLNVTPSVIGAITNTAYVNFDGIDSDFATSGSENKLARQTSVAAKSVDMGITIIPSTTSTVPRSSDISYTFSMINNGPDIATDLVLTITLPADVSRKQDAFGSDIFISEQDSQNNNLFICTAGLPIVTCTRNATLASGDSTFITLPLNINVNASTSFSVSASISHSLSNDPVSGNDSDTVTTATSTGTIPPETDLFVSISADPSQNVVVGDNLTYTATVRNDGPDKANDVVLTYHLPNNATFVAIESGCSLSGATATCPTWTLAPNTQASATLVVKPTAAVNVIASVDAINNTGEDPDASNNSASVSVNVLAADNGQGGFGAKAGSGCFIATAAYGSYLDPNVMALRDFRDDVLLRSEIGTALVHFYYRVSPPIADYISHNESLRIATRWALTPLVYGFKYPLAALFLVLLLAAMIIRHRKHPFQL